MTAVLASVGGDTAQWGLYIAIMAGVLAFWYVLLTGFGASGSSESTEPGWRNQDNLLADTRFGSMHRFVKWLSAACMLALIAECTLILPYVILRFGWSG